MPEQSENSPKTVEAKEQEKTMTVTLDEATQRGLFRYLYKTGKMHEDTDREIEGRLSPEELKELEGLRGLTTGIVKNLNIRIGSHMDPIERGLTDLVPREEIVELASRPPDSAYDKRKAPKAQYLLKKLDQQQAPKKP
jgi:hypothetical protein